MPETGDEIAELRAKSPMIRFVDVLRRTSDTGDVVVRPTSCSVCDVMKSVVKGASTSTKDDVGLVQI